MDRNTFIGFVLIGLVLMIWMWMSAPAPQTPQQVQPDSTAAAAAHAAPDTARAERIHEGLQSPDTLGKFFSARAVTQEKVLTVETDNYTAEITSRGGALRAWILNHFTTWNTYPLDLVTDTLGDFNLLFSTADGKVIDTRNLNFTIGYPGCQVTLHNKDSFKLELVLPVNENSRIVKTLTFYNGLYAFNCQFRFENMAPVISNFEYQVVWENGLRFAERNSIDESNAATSFAYAGGELTEVDAAKMNDSIKQNISGNINWVATRTKYFGLVIMARDNECQGAYLEGHHYPLPDHGAKEVYSLGLKVPFLGKDQESSNFTVYLGPLDFNTLKGYNADLEKIMNLGAAWIIRPIAQYVLMPLFQAIHYVIPNWGWVIIVFTIIIKIVLSPLSRSSLKSMKKMQAMQPMITELREKYKDDPQKMNAAVMRLYKEYGVNPAGGCLPMLIQLPILYALWAVFRSTIQLRHAPFFGWITDLSIPDVVARLPFTIPIFNVSELSGLALIMGITMFVQQKMTVKDPRQKATIWMMPILMTLLFMGFPSALNLYYLVFNILQIGQQMWMNRNADEEPLRKVEEKHNKPKGIFTRLAKDLPNLSKKR